MTKLQRMHAEARQSGDLLHGASALIDGYGNEAPTHAARQALALIASGDTEGYLMWLKILQAVDTLLDEKKVPETASLVA